MTQSLRTYRKSTDKEANEMASSNDIEVLDPTASVEKLKNMVSKVDLNRRHFMAALGVAGVAAGAGLGSDTVARAQQPIPNGYSQAAVLNFLLNIKYLKATFYSYVTQGADLPANYTAANGKTYTPTLGSGQIYNQPTAKITFTGTYAAQLTDMFNEMYYDELNQVIDLQQLLGGFATTGGAATARQTMDLLCSSAANPAAYVTPAGTPMSTGAQVIGMAQKLEDLSVTAFAYALSYLTGANLAAAAQILAIDGTHAGAVRLAFIQNSGSQFQYSGTANFSFSAGGVAGSNVIYGFLSTTAPLQVGYSISTGATVAITADANANGGNGSYSAIDAPSAVAYYGLAQPAGAANPGLTGLATVTAVGTIPSSYASGYVSQFNPSNGSHHINVLPDVPAALAQTWAVGMPVTDPSKYFQTPGAYIVGISQNPAGGIAAGTYSGNLYAGLYGGLYTVTMSATSGGHFSAGISVGTTPITLSTPFPSTGAFTASTLGILTADPQTVLPSDIGFFAATVTSGKTTVSVPSIAGLAVNQVVAGIGIPTGTTIASINSTAPYSIVLSAAPTASSTSFSVPALAAAGPTFEASSPVNQGFFATAGSANGTGNTPSGFAFARTFSQVLAVLYNSSASGTYYGGFFPVGVSGSINIV
jgi:hypothetical protein